MTNDPRKPFPDSDFERDLEAVRSAWDELEAVEPPALLDQAVRNAARRDLERPARKRPLHWLGGFATATVVVLALSLLFLQEPQAPVQPAEEIQLKKEKAVAPAAALRLEEDIGQEMAEPPSRAQDSLRANADRERSGPEKSSRDLMQVAAPAASIAVQEEEAGTFAEAVPETENRAAVPEPLPPPERWIEDMLALLEKGETEQLSRQLERFVESYPDHPLPAELAEHLP